MLRSVLPVTRPRPSIAIMRLGRRAVALPIALSLLVSLSAAPALAATPLVSMSLSVSPSPAIDGTDVTWRAVVKPVSGTPANLRLSMQSNWYQISTGSSFVPAVGTCAPAAYCSVDSRTGNPTWVFPTLTSSVTLTYVTAANGGATTSLWIESDGTGCSGTCPATATLAVPSTAVSLAWSTSTGDVPSGSTLHVTLAGSATAGPISATLQVELSSGLADPTAITPSSAYYYAPGRDVEGSATIGTTPATLSFDTVVTAANGSTVTLTAWVYPSNSKYGIATVSRTIKIGPDRVAPTNTAPKMALVTGRTISSGLLPVRLSWTGSDAMSGIARYEVGQSTDGGAYATVTTTLASSQLHRNLRSGHRYRFRVRAIDRAGNVGAWVYGSTFKLAGISQASGAVRYAGAWSNSTSTVWWGGTARSSSRAGATATFSFTGRSIAWVGLKAANRGKARVYVNGTLVATVDLYSATTLKQRYVWTANYSVSATRTIRIVVLGTSGRPRVDIDGFVVGS